MVEVAAVVGVALVVGVDVVADDVEEIHIGDPSFVRTSTEEAEREAVCVFAVVNAVDSPDPAVVLVE